MTAELLLAEPTATNASHDLLNRLQGPERAIADALGISGYLAIITVAQRERPAGRLTMPPSVVPAAIAAAQALGVHCQIGRLRMLSVQDAIPETRHAARFVIDDRPDALSLVYFGVSAVIAEGVAEVELRAEHHLLGKMFGYPECCTAFYLGSGHAGADRLPATIATLGPFHRSMNPILPYVYGMPGTLFHFPCSPGCTASMALHRNRMRILTNIDPSIRGLEALGAGLALYGPDIGICLATEYDRRDASTFQLHKIVTRSATTRAFFHTRARPEIRFTTPHDFEIDGQHFSTPGQFGALFA